MDLGTHAGFILGAFGFTALVVVALIVGAVLDQQTQKRALRRLQGDGAGRWS